MSATKPQRVTALPRKGVLGITHLSSAALLESKEQDALLSIEAAAAHTKTNTKAKRTAGLFSPCAFYF